MGGPDDGEPSAARCPSSPGVAVEPFERGAIERLVGHATGRAHELGLDASWIPDAVGKRLQRFVVDQTGHAVECIFVAATARHALAARHPVDPAATGHAEPASTKRHAT